MTENHSSYLFTSESVTAFLHAPDCIFHQLFFGPAGSVVVDPDPVPASASQKAVHRGVVVFPGNVPQRNVNG